MRLICIEYKLHEEMKTLKYTVIKTTEQYDRYCTALEELLLRDDKNRVDEIELLSLLIEKWDGEHTTFYETEPVELLKALMKEHNLKAKDLADILDLSKGTVSKILNYHQGFSKETIRKLSDYFKITHEAFNRPYPLKGKAGILVRSA